MLAGTTTPINGIVITRVPRTLTAALCASACIASFAVTPEPQGAKHRLSLSCAVAYLPARSTWQREVTLDYDNKRILAVQIDGQTTYAFSAAGNMLLTALDNERIQIDLAQNLWQSDFRGLASGQGRCELRP